MSARSQSQSVPAYAPESSFPQSDHDRAAPRSHWRSGRDPVDLSSWCSLILIASSASVLSCWLWEWDRSATFLGMAKTSLHTPDGVLLFLFITSKTLLLLTPSFVLAGILIWCGFRKTAHITVYLSILLVAVFSIADAFCASHYGCHVTDMLDVVKGGINDIYRFLHDASWRSGATGLAVIAGLGLVLAGFGGTTRVMARLFNRDAVVKRRGLVVAAFVATIAVIDTAAPLTILLRHDCMQPRFFLLLPFASFLPNWLPGDGLAGDGNPEVRRARSIASGLVHDAWSPAPVDANACVKQPNPPNILFVISECFRGTHFNAGAMPRLQAMARKGLFLENHYSGGNMTPMGLFSILYGRSCVVRDSVPAHNIPAQVCESLHASGYNLSFLVSDPTWARQGLLPMINPKHFDRIIAGEPVGFEESDNRLANTASRMLAESGDQPQCVFVFFAAPSPPYYYPAAFEKFKPCAAPDLFVNGFLRMPVEEMRNRYRNSLLYVEDLIVRMVERLDLNKTIVVVTGDHGESLGEDGWWWHGGAMSESQFRVPFFMLGKGIKPQCVSQPTSHADILPTLLHALSGSSVPVAGCHGMDVFNGVPADRHIDVTPKHFSGMKTVIVSGPTSRVLLKIGDLTGELREPEPVALLDQGGRIVLDSTH